MGTEPGKKRPVVVVQTELLNGVHPSTIVCPMTSQLIPGIAILRVRVASGGLDKPSDILVDQVRAIDNRRLIQKIGRLTKPQARKLQENLRIVLDL
jgi:mRNA interferase MazF